MSVKLHELKKVFSSPVIIGLTCLFIAYNLMIIFSNAYITKDLAVLNGLVDRFGYRITDQMVAQFEEYYEVSQNKMNTLLKEKTGESYVDASEFLKTNPFREGDQFTQQERDFISELAISENYYFAIPKIDAIYANMDMMAKAEGILSKYQVHGDSAEIIRGQYKLLADRLEQLKESGEHKNLFFMGTIYKMHSFLFKSLLNGMIYQLMILVVLITGYLVNYEFERKTHLLTYATKRGRRLILDKLLISMVSSVIVTTFLVSVTLTAYFMVFDYSGLWKVPISSAFNSEQTILFISWWSLTFIEYLLMSIALVYICQLLFTAIAFIIAYLVRNSYLVFFIFGLVSGACLVSSQFIPADSLFIFLPSFTPFLLIMNSFVWFMESSVFTTFKYYEISTAAIWTVLLFLSCSLCIRRFKKQNIW